MSKSLIYFLLFLRYQRVLRFREGVSPSKTNIGRMLCRFSQSSLLKMHFSPSSQFSYMELTLTIHKEASIASIRPDKSSTFLPTATVRSRSQSLLTPIIDKALYFLKYMSKIIIKIFELSKLGLSIANLKARLPSKADQFRDSLILDVQAPDSRREFSIGFGFNYFFNHSYFSINFNLDFMLSKALRRSFLFFSRDKESPNSFKPIKINRDSNRESSKDPQKETTKQNNKETPKQLKQYLLVPTLHPIFPHSIYTLRVNQYLVNHIKKYNIGYMVACVLQPGVAKKSYFPQSQSDFYQYFHLKKDEKQKEKDGNEDYSITDYSRRNIIFDQSTEQQQKPISYVDSIKQIFPIASLCKIFIYQQNVNQQKNKKASLLCLRSEIRFQINQHLYSDVTKKLMYVSGKTLKSQNIAGVGNQYKNLIEYYQKIRSFSEINTPISISQSTPTIRNVQALAGYLSTLSFLTQLQIYQLFKIVDMPELVKSLIKYYREYQNVLEVKWKYETEKLKKIEELSGDHKEYLRTVYENLQKILGHHSDVEYAKKIKTKLLTGKYPQNIVKIIQYELKNIQDLGQGNPEINRKKQFLNHIIEYPFGILAAQTYDIQKARQILNEEHYGMKKLKQRILQFIAVSKIKGGFKSKVLLLHGPPGVGKTSIVKSIAKCLNRPFGRISLGGQYDTSIMKGHRKTYVGAYPGKIFSTISKSKVQNPVILLDQIDKIQGRSQRASLQDVIMEVLDPIQNHKFKDQFLDIEIDLSKVLFICTANDLSTIFPPLLDRLEKIEVSGYTTIEKKEIFKRYVVKESMKNAGIPDQIMTKIDFQSQALNLLIQGYCREAGIRNLVRKTNSIFNKIALKYVKNQQFDKIITTNSLKTLLGLPKFRETKLFEGVPPKGVIIGLAYNAFGGSIMYIQAAAAFIKQTQNTQAKQLPKGSIIVTGNLHNVMKQSCQLAYSYAKYVTSTFFNNHFLEVNDIHLNFPQIQIGKDGPSAGVAITCSLVSLALNKPSIREIAMTGEITLSGKVSGIGGVKEKTMGAKREGIKHLIFPLQNKRDIDQLEEEIKQGVTFYFAEHFFEVLELVFGLRISVNAQSQSVA